VGVAGYEIKNGERGRPISEITIAGNLLEMYKTLVPANDLVMDGSKCSPAVRVEGLMIAGG